VRIVIHRIAVTIAILVGVLMMVSGLMSFHNRFHMSTIIGERRLLCVETNHGLWAAMIYRWPNTPEYKNHNPAEIEEFRESWEADGNLSDPLDEGYVGPLAWSYGGFVLAFAPVPLLSHIIAKAMIVPFWFPSAVIWIYPCTAFLRGPLRRWRRRRKGLCVRCAYNLRGNISGICPECGKPLRSGGPPH